MALYPLPEGKLISLYLLALTTFLLPYQTATTVLTTATPVAPSGPSTPVPVPKPPPAAQFTQHELAPLRRADLDPTDPITQFHAWFAAAAASGRVPHPETCTLATASLPSGRVSARMVYMKELDTRGWVVYTNLGSSRKAADLFGTAGKAGGEDTGEGGVGEGKGVQGEEGTPPNPHAALTFWWENLERQVRVEGRVERLPAAESQVYFATRARGSRIGAWASRQSAVLRPAGPGPQTEAEGKNGDRDRDGGEDDGRAQLDAWVAEAEARFRDAGEDIPVPGFWGGLRVVPDRVEFWQGRVSRLHDRFVYERVGEGGEWTVERLSP